MPIIDKDDKQIENLLENNIDLRAIKVDFNDLNNKSLIIKSSFVESYNVLDDKDKKDKWFFIAKMDRFTFSIKLISIVSMDINENNGYLNLYFIETNKIFKNNGYGKETLDYLKSYCKWRHLKGIIVDCIKQENFPIFKKNNFINIGNNSLLMKWDAD